MPDTVPTFLVAGAGRSGTTGLVEGLRTHPAVFVTDPKEPQYWAYHDQDVAFTAPGDDATINRVVVTDRAAYLALYDGAADAVARGDGSVSTLYHPDRAIPEIKAVNPAMRIVVMLREPVDRAFSSYGYMRARGFEPEETFAAALADEDRRVDAGWHHLWHYTRMSLYSEALTAFVDAFGVDQVGVWFYDELQSDYEGTVAQVLRFIGAPPVAGEASGVPRVNVSGTPRSAVAQRILQSAITNEPVRRTVKRLTSYRMREAARRRLLKNEGVDSADRAALEPQFEKDLVQLAALLRSRYPDRAVPTWLGRHG